MDLYGATPDERTGRAGLLYLDEWDCLVQKAITDEKAKEVLWEDKWTYDALIEQKKVIGHYAFSQEYQNSPSPLGGGMFKLDWLQFYQPDDKPKSGILGRYMGVDPAIGTKEETSWWGMAIVEVTDDLHIYVLELYGEHLDAPSGVRVMYEKCHQYNPSQIGMETLFYNESFLQWMHTLGMPQLPIIPLDCKASGPAITTKTSAKKALRLLNLTPYFQNHQIHLPSGAPWLDHFINREYAPFPDCPHDDRLDALEMAIRIIPKYSQEWKFY